jgi:hypothetical protein
VWPLNCGVIVLGSVQDGVRVCESIAQLIRTEWLEQIILNATCDEITVKANVIDFAGRDYDRPGLANFSKSIDIIQRIARF